MQSWPAFGGALEKEHVPRFMPGVSSFLRWDYPHLRIVAMTYSLHIETLMHHDFNVCTSSEKLDAFMQSNKYMFDVHSFPAIPSLLVRWARSAARRWRRARGPSAKFPPTCSMPSWPESSEISSSEEVWRTASSVPWREQNNDAGKQGFSEQKLYKKCIHMFLYTVAGRHVWKLSRLKFRIWKSCLEAA